MKKFPKSVSLLCSATTMFALWGTVAHAASPESVNNLPESSIANSTNNPINLSPLNSEISPASNPSLSKPSLPKPSLKVSAALPEIPSSIATSSMDNSRVEIPELANAQGNNSSQSSNIGTGNASIGNASTGNVLPTLGQTPVAPSQIALNPPSSPINLREVSTSAADIAPLPAPGNSLLAQRVGDRISPFTPTAYVGVGVNLGLNSGNSDLSQGRFLIYGKLGLTQNISLRPALLLGNQTTVLIPVTYDFPLQAADAIQPVSFVPYVGGGAIITSGSGNNNVGLLLSGGIDFPITRDFTATVALNAGFVRNTTDFGILLGVAYNIPGLRF